MIGAFDIALAVAATLVGALFVRFYQTGAGVVRRIEKQPTLLAADVTEGPAELAGKLRVVGEPLTSLDGVACAAIKRSILGSYDAGDSAGISNLETSTTTEIELEDASGSVLLELDQLILLGPRQRHELTGAALKEQHPDIWEALMREHQDRKLVTIVKAIIEETIVPDGAEGFVSGEASPSDRMAPGGAGYRGGVRRLKISGRFERPLIVAAWQEEQVVAFLRAPLRRTLAMGLLSLLLAAAAIAIPLAIKSHAGL